VAQKDHAHAIPAAQAPALFLGNRPKEGVGLLEQQSAAVSGLAVGQDRTPVIHSVQGADCGAHQTVTRLAVHVGDQTESAVVSYVIPIVYGHDGSPRFLWHEN
jgi:hypothetical protein